MLLHSCQQNSHNGFYRVQQGPISLELLPVREEWRRNIFQPTSLHLLLSHHRRSSAWHCLGHTSEEKSFSDRLHSLYSAPRYSRWSARNMDDHKDKDF